MKKLKIVEQDIRFLLDKRCGFGANQSQSQRRTSGRTVKSDEDRDPSFNGLCVARKDGEDWWIGKVLHSDIDKQTPTLNVYVVSYGTTEEEDDVLSLTQLKQYRDNYLKCRYQKGGFPPINNLNCQIDCDNLPISSPIKNSSVPTELIEIDLMDAFKEAGHKDTPEEKTKWLLCLRTIFMCDYWKDFIESVGRGSTKTYEEAIKLLESKIKKLEEGLIIRTGSGGSPVKKQKRQQIANDIEREIEKLNTKKQRLEQLKKTEEQKYINYTKNSQTLPLNTSATESNVKRQKGIIINQFKNAVRFIVNEISGKKLDNDQSLKYFYDLLDNDQKVSNTGVKYGETLSSIIKNLINKQTFGNGNTAIRVCRMLGEVMGITSFNPSDIVSNINADVLDYGKALERIIKHTKTRKSIQRLDDLKKFDIHVIADALGSSSKGVDIRRILSKHNTTTSVTPHTLLDDAAINNILLADILKKNKANVKEELDNYRVLVKFGGKVLIDYTLTRDEDGKNKSSYKLFGKTMPFFNIKIENFFELDCKGFSPIRNSDGHINIAEGWDRIFNRFNEEKSGGEKFTDEEDICTKLYKTLMDLGKVLLFEPRTRINNVPNVFVSIDRNITLLAAIFLKNSTSIYISPTISEGDIVNYLSIFIKSVDKDVLFQRNTPSVSIPISPSQSLQEEESDQALVSQELQQDIGPLLLDALMLPGDIYVAPPAHQPLPQAVQQAISSGHVSYSARTLPSRQSSQAAQNNGGVDTDRDQVTSPQTKTKTKTKLHESGPQTDIEIEPMSEEEKINMFNQDQAQKEETNRRESIRSLRKRRRSFFNPLRMCAATDIGDFLRFKEALGSQFEVVTPQFYIKYDKWRKESSSYFDNSKNKFLVDNLYNSEQEWNLITTPIFEVLYDEWLTNKYKDTPCNLFGKTSKQVNDDIRYLLTLK